MLVVGHALPVAALTVVSTPVSITATQRHEAPVRSVERHVDTPGEPSFAFKAAGWAAILSIFALVGTTARRRSPSRIVTH